MASESTNPNTFCPSNIFDRLDCYITQIKILENIPVSNLRKFSSRTLGLISLSEKLGQKDIEITKNGETIYCASFSRDWVIVQNQLDSQQILAIENLPQTREQIFLEFYSRKLTQKLKDIFQPKKYPINKTVSLNHAQVPYNFFISSESTTRKIIFIGKNTEGGIVFKSFFYSDGLVEIIVNNLPLEHIDRLCCFS